MTLRTQQARSCQHQHGLFWATYSQLHSSYRIKHRAWS